MATYLQGQQSSTAQNSETIVKDVESKVYYLDPETTPLCALINATGSDREVHNHQYWYQAQDSMDRWVIANGTQASGITNLLVDDSTMGNAGDIMVNPASGEHMLITDKQDGTHVTIVRGYGSTAAAEIADNATLQIIGNAFVEGGTSPVAISRDVDTTYNYLQIFKRSLDVTNTAKNTKYYSGDLLEREIREKGMEFAKDMEFSALFGERKAASGAQPRTSLGLRYSISTNVYNAAGTLTEDNFEKNFLEGLFRYGDSTKLFLASPRLCSTMDFWGRSKLSLNVDDNLSAKLGCRVVTYISTHGELKVVRHKLLERGWSGYGFAVDLKNFKRVHLRNRKAKLEMNIQNPDVDGVKHQYIAEVGWENTNEKTHGYIYGVTGGA